VLSNETMECDRKARDGAVFEQLLRRAQIVVEHYRYRSQPVDARGVVERVLAVGVDRPADSLQYRAVLQEAVCSWIHGFR
jgi:hypothetical protein